MASDRLLAFVRERLIYVWIVSVGLWCSWWGWLLLTTLGVIVDESKVFTDHMAFYSGANLILDGRGEVMYDYALLGFEQRRLIGLPGEENRPLTAIRNPPFYFLLYTPTARLPYIASFWIWSIISLGMLYLGFRCLGVERPWIAIAWATSFYPVFATISFGQNSLLSFAILCAVYLLLKRDRPYTAGMVAGLLSFKPTVMLGLLLWWFLDVRRYWRCWLGLMVTGAILLVITLIFVRKEFEVFLAILSEIAAYDRDDFYNHHTLRAFWGYFFGDNKPIGLKFGLVSSCILVFCFLFFWYRYRKCLPIIYGGLIYFTLMASPHALVYEWTLILIPAVIWWREYPQNRDRWLLLYTIPWVVLLVGTQATKFQSNWFEGFAFHFSPVILTIMGFVFAREWNRLSSLQPSPVLASSNENTHADHPPSGTPHG
jgi:hypothetical protein